jgi:hypothetical protein
VDWKRNPWVVLLWKILFRVAFGGLILLQFVLLVLLLWALSLILPEDNRIVTGTFIVLTLISPFAIGAASHFAFQRFTRVEYILAESERWLADRSTKDVDQIRRCNRLRRWALWIPALSVLLFCLFLGDTWPPTSHLLTPTAGRLIG